MYASQAEITLELTPNSRLDVIDVTRHLRQQAGDWLFRYPKALYCSYHTTAGYFEQSLCAKLNHNPNALRAFIEMYQRLFPPNADYHHDQLHLRTELSDKDRFEEPRNADSHLTFIGSGLSSSVIYTNSPSTPVFLVDLDGIHGNLRRRRQTTVIPFQKEEVVSRLRRVVPVSDHPIDSVNLKDSRLGLFEELESLLHRYEIQAGRIDITLAPSERHAGLTVNEYETLLMKHDLLDVLHDPLRFMAEKGKHMLMDPKSILGKAKDYAKYDLVQVVNEFVDRLGLRETILERVIDKFLAVPAERFLRMKRMVSFPVSDHDRDGKAEILQGLYQSPVLVQWEKAERLGRQVDITLVRFL